MSIINRNLTDVIDDGYHEYAMYVLESRAIPSVIDGLKMVNRKLLYSMINDHGGKRIKLAEIGGGLAKCVLGDTIVLHNEEYKTIEEVHNSFIDGDVIYSFNEHTNKFEHCELMNTMKKNKTIDFIELTLECGDIISLTPDHLVLLQNGNWVEARNLTESDEIMST